MSVKFSTSFKALRANLPLIALCAALLAFCAWLLSGAGRAPNWLPPQPLSAVTTATGATAVNVPELSDQRLARIWGVPLFSPERKPDAAALDRVADTGLAGLTLSGVVINGQAQWALLRQGPRSLRLKVGDRLTNGWLLEALSPREATFSHQGQQRRLNLVTPRLPPPGEDVSPRLPASSVPHSRAPNEAELLEDAP